MINIIKVVKESPDSIELFNDLLKYAKSHKNKFLSIKSSSITFKKTNGVYEVFKDGNEVSWNLDGDPAGPVKSLDEFINLINIGDTK